MEQNRVSTRSSLRATNKVSHQRLLPALGSELGVGAPCDDVVAGLECPVLLPVVAVVVAADVVPTLTVTTCRKTKRRFSVSSRIWTFERYETYHRKTPCR